MDENLGCIEEELQDAKLSLTSLNDDIRRVFGPNAAPRIDSALHNEVSISDNYRIYQSNDSRRNPKPRSSEGKRIFNRLSTSKKAIDTDNVPRINSRVIRELPTRQEVVAAQGTDSESKARNKRIFSSLLGTLQKFCQEESRLREKEDKKAQIERKLEEQEVQEREILKKQRETLFLERKRKQIEIRFLESKMNRLKDYEIWKASLSYLQQNIRTKTKPHIYFRPRTMNKISEKLLIENQLEIDHIKTRRQEVVRKDICSLKAELKTRFIDYECVRFNKIYNEAVPTKYNSFVKDIFPKPSHPDNDIKSNEEYLERSLVKSGIKVEELK